MFWNWVLWNETISCHINKQEMAHPSATSSLQMWMRAPKTVIQHMLPPPMVITEELGNARSSHLPLHKVNRETRLAPDSWAAYGRNESSESRGLHLPTHRMLNSLTWYPIFDVQPDCFFCCKLMCSLTCPPAFLEQFSQSYWDAVSRTWSPKHSHQIK